MASTFYNLCHLSLYSPILISQYQIIPHITLMVMLFHRKVGKFSTSAHLHQESTERSDGSFFNFLTLIVTV